MDIKRQILKVFMTSPAPEYCISINLSFQVWCTYSRRHTKQSLAKQFVNLFLSLLPFHMNWPTPRKQTQCSALSPRAQRFTSKLTRAQRFSTAPVYTVWRIRFILVWDSCTEFYVPVAYVDGSPLIIPLYKPYK